MIATITSSKFFWTNSWPPKHQPASRKIRTQATPPMTLYSANWE